MADCGWINTSIIRPKNGSNVRMKIQTDLISTTCDGYYCYGTFYNKGGVPFSKEQVVSWMPLPEPYEEEENE